SVDALGHAVLNQVLAFQLLDGTVREVHVTPVIQMSIQLIELGARVVLQQMRIVATFLGLQGYVIEQAWRFKLTKSDFAQMENRQTGSQILVVRRIFGNQIRSRLDDRFVDVASANAVIELNVRAQLYLRDGHITQTFSGPINHSVNLVEVNRFCTAISFSDH